MAGHWRQATNLTIPGEDGGSVEVMSLYTSHLLYNISEGGREIEMVICFLHLFADGGKQHPVSVGVLSVQRTCFICKFAHETFEFCLTVTAESPKCCQDCREYKILQGDIVPNGLKVMLWILGPMRHGS